MGEFAKTWKELHQNQASAITNLSKTGARRAEKREPIGGRTNGHTFWVARDPILEDVSRMGLKGPIFRGCLEEFAHFGSQGTHFYGMSGGICTFWISRDPFSEDVLRNPHRTTPKHKGNPQKHTETYRITQNHTETRRNTQKHTETHRNIQEHTEQFFLMRANF